MKVYAVFVRHRNLTTDRFIDSQWAVEQKASDRMRDLNETFLAFKADFAAWVVTLMIEDLQITEPTPERAM